MDEFGLLVKIQQYLPLIKTNAYELAIEPALLAAFIWQESGGETKAIRFEPSIKFNFTANKFAKALSISQETEVNCQNTSWGLLQILGVRARELGFDGYLTDLLVPEIGISYGCKNIAALQLRYRFIEDLIAAYNAGSALRRDGRYINMGYVEDVKVKWAKLEKLDLFK